MTTQELLELAVLDAFGLLEGPEAEAFDSALAAAAPAVQAQVRREQTRMAAMDEMLPDVQPPAGLRASVLDTVRRDMAGADVAESDTAGAAAALSAAGLAPGRLAIVPMLMPSTRVSPMWRAGALGLLAACIVLSVTTLVIQRYNRQIQTELQKDALLRAMVESLGPPYVRDVLFDTDTSRSVFQTRNADFRGEAAVFYNKDWKEARFFANAIDGRGYRLAIIDENGNVVKELADLNNSDGALIAKSFALDPKVTRSLAILDSAKAVVSSCTLAASSF